MDYPSLVHEYGAAAIIFGTFFEGEAVLLVGGIAAREGLIDYRMVFLCGFIGVFLSDSVCFVIGRWFGRSLLRRFPRIEKKAQQALEAVSRHQTALAIGFQFLPGTSTVTPIAFGLSNISLFRFIVLDLIGVSLWTSVFALSGYFSAAVLEFAWRQFAVYQWTISSIILLTGLGFWIHKVVRRID